MGVYGLQWAAILVILVAISGLPALELELPNNPDLARGVAASFALCLVYLAMAAIVINYRGRKSQSKILIGGTYSIAALSAAALLLNFMSDPSNPVPGFSNSYLMGSLDFVGALLLAIWTTRFTKRYECAL